MNRNVTGAAAFGVAIAVATINAQVGRGGSEWLTARGDAQRTSWIRTDARISVASMSKPGFALQWKKTLDNRNRQAYGLGQGVSANGVTLFVPMTIVTGSSNNVYAIDNDTGYIVWQRHFDAAVPAPTASCPGGMTSAPTRIVALTPPPIAAQPQGGRAAQAYRSVIGQPGEGAPVEVRGGGAGRAGAPPAAGAPGAAGPGGGGAQGARGAQGAQGAPGAQGAQGAQGAPPRGGGGGFGGPAGAPIPGATPEQLGGGRGGLARASGVVYTISSDGVLHVMGLPSGKDIQKPAEFVPANARWSDAVAVNTTLYTATFAGCGGAPNAVWAIDLESEGKPVVSWKSGGPIVGAIAFTTNGTLIAAVGPGTSTDGKPNAIVALDPKTLQVKDWFSAASTEFVTGPTILRGNDKDRELVAVATKDGRVVLLDAASLGGADHATPLATAPLGAASAAGESLANWQEMTITQPPPPPPAVAGTPGTAPAPPPQPTITYGTRWILAPTATTVAAFKVVDNGGSLTLERGWTAGGYAAPATPVVVNGVVFLLSTGRSTAPAGRGTPAGLHAYDGTTGKELWTSGKTMAASAVPGSFWSSFGQTYVGTSDGTLYAFGFLDERR